MGLDTGPVFFYTNDDRFAYEASLLMPSFFTFEQICQILNGSSSPLPNLALPVTGVATDTRTLQPGELFIALRGEKFDGHQFINTAIERGAVAAIVDERVPTSHPHVPLVQVADTLQAYQALACAWRQQFSGSVIAITGSVGKTTTKELIAAVLSTQGSVLKSQSNFNNEIGVPKTLLQIQEQHNYAVVEMGMRGPGQIALLSQIAQPDIAVITNVGTAHIGILGSEAAIAQAKCELLAEMPKTAVAVLNADNPLLMETAAQVWSGKTVTFGLEHGDVRGDLLSPDVMSIDGLELPLPLAGRHHALNYLAALAVAKVLGISWIPLTEGLSLTLPEGRATRIELPQDVIVLDETYNAGLESMLASLKLLADSPGQRRIAVLGTMKELGDRSPEFHRQVGQTVRDLKLDHLLILADEAEGTALSEGAAPLASTRFNSYEPLVERLTQLVQPGDRILFKASRAIGLEKAVAAFCQTYVPSSGV
jgi:UDP-N-acetylmuramoyl-tripeptide--D-alanyl-D-alanine ligase